MKDFLTAITGNIEIANFFVNLGLMVFTLIMVLVAIFAFAGQLRALNFNRWTTLKSVYIQLYILEKELNLRRESERDEESLTIVNEELESIKENRKQLLINIEQIEKKLRIK